MKKLISLVVVTFLVLAASGCDGASPPAAAPASPPPTATPKPTEPPPTDAPTEEPTPAREPLLPADPVPVTFWAEDEQELHGTYYPAAYDQAPTVVLMHWAPGDQTHWEAIAAWLQNRGAKGPGGPSWLDSSWFPPMPDGLSFGIFTFTFRECEGGDGCQSFEPAGWLLDAQAAMEVARNQPGVDPFRLAAVGASIGSDGAVDVCGELCLGALSLSPGGYLGVPYDEAVTSVDQEGKPVWCLAAEGDTDSAEACRSASGDDYQTITYPSDEHGLALIKPGMEPDTLETILEFLKLVFEL